MTEIEGLKGGGGINLSPLQPLPAQFGEGACLPQRCLEDERPLSQSLLDLLGDVRWQSATKKRSGGDLGAKPIHSGNVLLNELTPLPFSKLV